MSRYLVQLLLLLDEGVDVNAQGGYSGNAMQEAASFSGYEMAVRLLLEKRAVDNAQGGPSSTALQAVSFGGPEAVVQLLLDKGAELFVYVDR